MTFEALTHGISESEIEDTNTASPLASHCMPETCIIFSGGIMYAELDQVDNLPSQECMEEVLPTHSCCNRGLGDGQRLLQWNTISDP